MSKTKINIWILFEFDYNIHNYDTNSSFRHLLQISRIYAMVMNLLNFIVQLYGTTLKNDIALNGKVANNVSIDQIHNVFQFNRISNKHFLYCYTLE